MLEGDSDAAIGRRTLLKAAGLGALGLPVGAAASGSSRRAASDATDAAAVQQSGVPDWVLKRHNIGELRDADGIDVADITDSDRSNLVTANGDNGEAHVWEWNEAKDSWSDTKIYSGGPGSELEGAFAHDLDGDGVPEVYLMDQGDNKLVQVTREDDAGEEWESWVWDDDVHNVQTARVYERPGEEPEEALYVAYEGKDEDDGGIKRYWYTEEFSPLRSKVNGSATSEQVPHSEWIVHHPGAWGLSIEQRDIDGDGTLEFLLGARGSKNDDHVNGLYYVTSDPHGSWTYELIDRFQGGTRPEYDPIGYSHVYFGDMTGDGVRKDVVACGWPAQDEAGHWFRYDDDFSHHTVGDANDKYWNAKPFDIGEDRDAVVLCHKVDDRKELELYVYDDGVGDWTRRSGHPLKKADDQLPAVDFGDGAANFASVSANSHDLDWWEIERAGAGEPAIWISKYPIIDDELQLTALGFPHSTDESTYEWQVFESAALETRVATGEGQQLTTTLPDDSYFVAVRAEREDGVPVTAYRTVEAGLFPARVAYDATVLDGSPFGALGFNVYRDGGRIYVKPSGADVAKGDHYEFDVQASGGTIEDVQKESWNGADSIDTPSDDRLTGDGSIGRNGGYDQFSFTTDGDPDALRFDLHFVSHHAPNSPDEQRPEFVHLGGDGQMPAGSPFRIEFDHGPIGDVDWSADDGSWSGDAGDGDDGSDDEDCLEFLPDDRTPTAAELRAYNKCLNRNEDSEDDGGGGSHDDCSEFLPDDRTPTAAELRAYNKCLNRNEDSGDDGGTWSGDAGNGDGGSWSGDAGNTDEESTDDEDDSVECTTSYPDDRPPSPGDLIDPTMCENPDDQGDDGGSWSGDAGDDDGGTWSGDAGDDDGGTWSGNV